MQISQSATIINDSFDYDRTEKSKRYNALKLENIRNSLLSKCKFTHDDYKCDGCCLHKFPSPELLVDQVLKLRQKIWGTGLNSGLSSRSEGRDLRNSIVLNELLSHRFNDVQGKYQIQFVINGIRICKNFYYKCTGLSKKLFEALINYVTNKNCTVKDNYFDKLVRSPMFSSFHVDIETIIKNRPNQRQKKTDSSLKDNVLAFLDIQFANGIDFAPENDRDRYTHLSWNELYLLYKCYCSQLCIQAADYTLFCRLR